MKIRAWTSEEEEWLKINYATKSDFACKTHLRTSYQQIWHKADELGLKKDNPSDFERARKITKKASRRCLHMDDLRQGYCMDCIHYIPGGNCNKTEKSVGALWQKRCFNGEA